MSVTGNGREIVDEQDGPASHQPTDLTSNSHVSRAGIILRGGGDMLPERSSSPALKRSASDLEDKVNSSGEKSSLSSGPPNPPNGKVSPSSFDTPSIDEQIARVTALSLQSPEEGQKGYLVAGSWLERVKAKGSSADAKGDASKDAVHEDIGPVDNSSLVAEASDTAASNLKDEAREPFVPLKPGLAIGEDYEILPQEAWELILRWYGNAKGSPEITRYAHNTNPDGAVGTENLQYESYPPTFIISKLRNDGAGLPLQALKEANAPPLRIVASRSETYNSFLKRVKPLVGLDLNTKVRVWRLLSSRAQNDNAGMMTPAASRSVSPAPNTAATSPLDTKLIVDLNTFLALEEGSERELLDVTDQTANEKYNGHLTLAMAGLTQDSVVVLEERIGGPAGGEWVSDATGKSASMKGVPLSVTKNGITTVQNKSKAKANTASGRSSPAPSTGGIMTRGRVRRDGRTVGTVGLSNLGNTCYMNSALQCVRSVEELTQYFRLGKYKEELNPSNPLAHNGDVAKSYASLLDMMYSPTAAASVTPRAFKNTIGRYGPSFSGYGQQDSQEFLGFLLDGLQEDLNRIHEKPYIEKPDSTDEMVHDPVALRELADRCWGIYKARNDSVIADLFAGTYKSTLVCPVCEKVSITFDPFNNLTLQLPIENIWSKQIYYFPLDGPPKRVMVDMDKNGGIKALKEFVATRVKVDPQRLHAVEIYKAKVYKVYDDHNSVSESIQERDDVALFELAGIPTNFPPPKKKTQKLRAAFSLSYGHSEEDDEVPAWDSPLAENMLVPVFNRVPRDGSSKFHSQNLFAFPFYITIKRSEAYDFDAIFRKVLEKAATMTTRDILQSEEDDEAFASAEEDDMVVTTSEDADSSGGARIKTDSSGEDGFVDVSMTDPNEASQPYKAGSGMPPDAAAKPQKARSKVLQPGSFLPPELRNLFKMRVFTQAGELIPTGWHTSLEENRHYPLMESRIPSVTPSDVPRLASAAKVNMPGDHSPASEDDLDGSPGPLNNSAPDNSSETENDSEEFPDVQDIKAQPADPSKKSRSIHNRFKHTHSKKGKLSRSPSSSDGPTDGGPLVRLGEAIILDWTADAYEALFSGSHPNDGMRGTSTWDQIDLLPDEALDRKRALRSSRRKKGVSLGDCLDEFGKEEILSENDAWYCPRCKEFRRASKKFELWKCPDILVIHLKRFSASRGLRDKIDVLVDFPIEGLDLNDRVALKEEGKSCIYDLIAVDNHYGGLGGGHYTACARNFIDGNWYDYNDTMASKKSPQQAVTSAAYLLFYRRRSEGPLGGPNLELVMDEILQEAASAPSSRAESPAGDEQRLDDSSRTGSSSALRGAGAAHRAAGGLAGGSLARASDGDPPAYSSSLHLGETGVSGSDPERMQLDEGVDVEYGEAGADNPLNQTPSWGFGFQHGLTQMTAVDPGSDDENIMDGASDKAADGSSAASRGSSARMKDFEDDEDDDLARPALSSPTTAPASGMPGAYDVADEDLDDAPVAEVHVEEGEGLVKGD